MDNVVKSYPVIINRKIRIAIASCGRILINHIESLKKQHDSNEFAYEFFFNK